MAASAKALDMLVYAALGRFLADASLITSALEMMSQEEAAEDVTLVALLDEVGTVFAKVHEPVLAASSSLW